MADLLPTVITTIGSVIVAMVTVGLPLLSKSKKAQQKAHEELIAEIKKTINNLQCDMGSNTRLTVVTARAQLESIHKRYKHEKKMPESSWKAVCELHEAYKAAPVAEEFKNHYADELYHEMEIWEKV